MREAPRTHFVMPHTCPATQLDKEIRVLKKSVTQWCMQGMLLGTSLQQEHAENWHHFCCCAVACHVLSLS